MRQFFFLLLFVTHFSYSSDVNFRSQLTCTIKLSQVNTHHNNKIFYFNGNVSREGYENSDISRYLFSRIATVKPQLCDPQISGDALGLDSFFLRHVNAHGTYVGTIYFDTGIDAVSSLDSVRLKTLLNNQTYQAMIFVGRADSTGETNFNQDLSYRRAANAQKALANNAAGVLIALGDRQTPQEKADVNRNNRRVDIYVFSYPGADSR